MIKSWANLKLPISLYKTIQSKSNRNTRSIKQSIVQYNFFFVLPIQIFSPFKYEIYRLLNVINMQTRHAIELSILFPRLFRIKVD